MFEHMRGGVYKSPNCGNRHAFSPCNDLSPRNPENTHAHANYIPREKGVHMGRKAIEWSSRDCEIFKSLCAIFCTRDEICQVMRVDKKTLLRLVNENFAFEVTGYKTKRITFEDAFEYFSAEGKKSLRRKQVDMAMDGNTTMLVWLGKCYLGQSAAQPAGAKAKDDPPKKGVGDVSGIVAFRRRSPAVKAATG